jgi:lipopolysaccharide biosynthesis regulator YciM
MSDPNVCPSCGRTNFAGATECANCNFPLVEAPERVAATTAQSQVPPTPPKPATPEAPHEETAEPVVIVRPMRPIRQRRPGGPEQKLQMQLWLVLGGLSILFILYTAVDGFKKNARPPAQVEGAKENQQRAADLARKTLETDSTNIQARIALADVLYDTANWSEAIISYKSAIRMDPSRATSYVDLGVCYFNLGKMEDAVALFKKARTLDPQQPIALFNLGVVAESKDDYDGALKYYHRAMQANPPDQMGQALTTAIQRIMEKQGKKAPPLPDGSTGAMPPSGK